MGIEKSVEEMSGMELDQAVVRVKWANADITYTDNFGDKYVYAGHTGLGGGKNEPEAWANASAKVIEEEYRIWRFQGAWMWQHRETKHGKTGVATEELARVSAKLHYVLFNARPAAPAEPSVEEMCDTCPHAKHSGQCGAGGQCLCCRYPELDTVPTSAPVVIAEVETAEAGQSDENPAFRRIPRSPLCAKAGLWPYPCHGRIELQKGGSMKGSFLCEEHGSQAQPTSSASAKDACESCGAGPLGNCGYGGCERPRSGCPLTFASAKSEEKLSDAELDSQLRENGINPDELMRNACSRFITEASTYISRGERVPPKMLTAIHQFTAPAVPSQGDGKHTYAQLEEEWKQSGRREDPFKFFLCDQLAAARERISELVSAGDGLFSAACAIEWLGGFCPSCGVEECDESHAMDCRLNAALRTYAAAKGEGNGTQSS